MTSNFRSNLSQFRWTEQEQDSTQQQPANPFSRFYNAIGGDYVPLRSNERSNEDEAWFALSSWERYASCFLPTMNHHQLVPIRLAGFVGCLVGAAVCFFVSFLTLPLLALRYALVSMSMIRR
jgi:hypothetical protein